MWWPKVNSHKLQILILAFMIQKTLNESDVMKFNMTHCFGLHDSENTLWIQQSSHEIQHEFGFGLHDIQKTLNESDVMKLTWLIVLAFMIQKTLYEFSSPVMKFNMNLALAFMIHKTVNELAVIENSVNQAMTLWACLWFGPLS